MKDPEDEPSSWRTRRATRRIRTKQWEHRVEGGGGSKILLKGCQHPINPLIVHARPPIVGRSNTRRPVRGRGYEEQNEEDFGNLKIGQIKGTYQGISDEENLGSVGDARDLGLMICTSGFQNNPHQFCAGRVAESR